MKPTIEIRPFPNAPMAAQLAELHKLADSTRMGLLANTIGMQTTKGMTFEPDPLKTGRRSMGMSGTGGPARWG